MALGQFDSSSFWHGAQGILAAEEAKSPAALVDAALKGAVTGLQMVQAVTSIQKTRYEIERMKAAASWDAWIKANRPGSGGTKSGTTPTVIDRYTWGYLYGRGAPLPNPISADTAEPPIETGLQLY
jgi:hypothetical protein